MLLEVFSDAWTPMLLYALVEMSTCVADIAGVTPATLKFIYHAVIRDKSWFLFFLFEIWPNLFWRKDRLNFQVQCFACGYKLFLYNVCRFLRLKRQNNSYCVVDVLVFVLGCPLIPDFYSTIKVMWITSTNGRSFSLCLTGQNNYLPANLVSIKNVNI